MPLTSDAVGLVWLDPKHIDVKSIEADIVATSIDAASGKYSLTSAEWRKVAEGLGQMYRQGAGVDPTLLNAVVNLAFFPHALSLPSYCTWEEAKEIDAIMFQSVADMEGAKKIICNIVFNPRMRAIHEGQPLR